MRRKQIIKNKDTLSEFKKQIHNILEDLNNFDENERRDAFRYVKKHFSSNDLLRKNVTAKANRLSVLRNTITKRKSIKLSLRCAVCSKDADTKANLMKHMELHIGSPITCLKCRCAFNNRASYDWHILYYCNRRKKSATRKSKCSQCFKEFVSRNHLAQHQAGHRRNNCTHCNAVLAKRPDLIRHLLKEHNIKLGRRSFKCNNCERTYVKQRSLFYHLQQQHLKTKFICLDCGHVSNFANEHENHVEAHEEKKHWQCSKCKDKFSRRQLYLNHLKRHDRYKCLSCKENFASRVHALKHKRCGHMVQGLEPRLQCPYCPATFYRSLLLQAHLYKHRDEEAILDCRFCNKSFPTPRQYFKHCLTESHDKNSCELYWYICEYCGKQFMKKYMFEQHLRRFHDTQLGNYSCQFCNYKSKYKPNLHRHLKLHFTKENQFMCDHCGKCFSNEAVLIDHIKYKHIEIKQINCSKCNKSFKRKCELTKHLKSHSDERPFGCELCSLSYKRVSHLRRHEEHIHGIPKKSSRVKRLAVDPNSSTHSVQIESEKGDEISLYESTLDNTIDFKQDIQSCNSNQVYVHVLETVPVILDQDQVQIQYINFIQ
ncbi:hypothetical protein FQA39_LY13395 [Lamprigera yunnana]|nr:hypothetical protein FQA39_LY13395 [Lamprigera yunnana]